MSEHLDPNLAAFERRLDRTLTTELAPALRHRVLMAVDDVLAETVPGTKSANSGQFGEPAYPDLVPGTFLCVPGWAWAAAAAVGVAITLPVVAGASVLARVEPPSLEARLRAAGLADDVLLLSAAAPAGQPAVAEPREPALHEPPARMHVRVIDVRKCLEENL
jgi:hypothetical protein